MAPLHLSYRLAANTVSKVRKSAFRICIPHKYLKQTHPSPQPTKKKHAPKKHVFRGLSCNYAIKTPCLILLPLSCERHLNQWRSHVTWTHLPLLIFFFFVSVFVWFLFLSEYDVFCLLYNCVLWPGFLAFVVVPVACTSFLYCCS